jgi:hypothetical protein
MVGGARGCYQKQRRGRDCGRRSGGGGDQARSEWRPDARAHVCNRRLAVFHAASDRIVLKPGKMSWAILFMWARPDLKIQMDCQLIQLIKLAKFETSTSTTTNMVKLGMVVDKFKRNIFPFEKKFKFPTKFELKI